MKDFITYINSIVDLDKQAVHDLQSILVERRLPKKALLISAGAVCTEFHFIIRGAARVFYYKDQKEATAWFGFERDIVSAIDSLFSGQPTIYNIELLEDSVLCSLQFHLIEPVFAAHPKIERLGRLLITENYLKLDERMRMIVFHDARERYQLLLQQFPNILNRVPLKYIASYLNITQEALSRIRAEF